MALRDILVHLEPSERGAARMRLAVAMAARHGAHLAGVFVIDIPPPSMTMGYEMAYAMDLPGGWADQIRSQAQEAGQAVRAGFEAEAKRQGVSAEWRMVEGIGAELLALHARYADLAIIGQPDTASRALSAQEISASSLITSGRPVLTVPFAGTFTSVEGHALVAWNASREAARAVNDALPLLERCSKVTVLAINPRLGIGGHGDVPAADIALHLARHGIRAEAAHMVARDIAEGEALLSYAADAGAELIVMGAWGHSRAREWAFGGVTRTLLRSMTVPVLMSA
jgi:nucleotide-binding universal stress UspA family protein